MVFYSAKNGETSESRLSSHTDNVALHHFELQASRWAYCRSGDEQRQF